MNEPRLQDLFGSDSEQAYRRGLAAQLVSRRNRHLANLLNTERSVYYVQILYCLLRFRRAHELEPLHEDLYRAVLPAQEAITEDHDYPLDRFREDLRALIEWKLVEERIEKQRLRGYRDTRRKKFRYSMPEETLAFLEWLVERLRDDLEERVADTRNLLESVLGTLKELKRVLFHIQTKRSEEGDPRRVLFHLGVLDAQTHSITDSLVALNARMYGFVMKEYSIEDARTILNELAVFVDRYLRQVHQLRGAIIATLNEIKTERNRDKIRYCVDEMETERLKAPHLMRKIADPSTLVQIPETLFHFYRDGGTLDRLRHRIHKSSVKVWQKLNLRLRELERKSHRLEDLRARINEIVAMPEEAVVDQFLFELLAPAHMVTDPQFWDGREKAAPPQPRRRSRHADEDALPPLAQKPTRAKQNIRTHEQERLRQLKHWLEQKVITPEQAVAWLRDSRVEEFEDVANMMELMKNGRLVEGKRLQRIGFQLEEHDGQDAMTIKQYLLTLPSMQIRRGDKHG